MNTKFKKIVGMFVAVVAVVAPSVSFAAALNNDALDFATLRVANKTTNAVGCTTCWTSTANANAGEVVSFAVYYHNTGVDTATNVRVRLTPQTTVSGTTHSFSATVSADNAPAVSGAATVYTTSSQTLSFLNSSVSWYPNQGGVNISLPLGQSGAELFNGTGLNLGNITPGWAAQGSITVSFQVSSGSSAVAPSVSTNSANPISQNSATLNGYVAANGISTTAWFEWGTTTSFGNSTTNYYTTSATNFSNAIFGLSPNTTYYYRAVAQNSQGRVDGTTMSFTTSGTLASVPVVTTNSASSVSQNSATLNGYVTPNGASTSAWFEYGTTQSFGSNTSSVNYGTTATSFNNTLFSLSQNTTYYYRAVAQNSQGTVYGSVLSFTTSGNSTSVPVVTTNSASSVSQNSATLNGYVAANGISTTAWFEWGTTTSFGNSTTNYYTTSATNFSNAIFGLSPNTTYYYRAVAQNSQGRVDGTTMSFTTSNNSSAIMQATVTTQSATNIAGDSATLNGYVDPNGTSDTMRWFEWGTNTNPGSQNQTVHYSQGTAAGSFSASLSGLMQNTTYYYRAVAQNSQGRVDGTVYSFTTGNAGNNCGSWGWGSNCGNNVVMVSTRNADTSGDFAVLNGYVDPNGSNDTVRWFEWGGSQSLGNSTQKLSHGSVASNFSASLTGLVPNTIYYYRAVGRNSLGTVYGNTLSFTTSNQTAGLTGSSPTATTLLATEITGATAKLNGLVFTSANQPSNAWFEWGTSSTLGNKTQTVGAGMLPAVKHSDVITGLTDGQTYYYRIVAENPYGKVYGTIMNFVSDGTPIAEDTTVVINQAPRITPVSKAATIKSTITVVEREGTAQSLVALAIDGGAEVISSGEKRPYHITWKNGPQSLKNVVLRVMFPQTMTVDSATRGSFSGADNSVTIDIKTLASGEEGEAFIFATVDRGLKMGEVIVVTANMVYSRVNGNQGDAIAYVTHRVETESSALGANIFGAGSFVPTTLFEWILLMILVLILVLLGNYLYGRFTEKE